jgi:hypothetical protein
MFFDCHTALKALLFFTGQGLVPCHQTASG